MAETVNWGHILAEAAVSAAFIVIPILLAGYVAWKRLWWMLREYRPHRHDERAGQLSAEGISYPRTMNER